MCYDTVFVLFISLYFEAISKIQAPGDSYSEGLLNGGFFAFRDWGGGGRPIFGGAYTWRGLFSEFHSLKKFSISTHHKTRHLERLREIFWSKKAFFNFAWLITIICPRSVISWS